MSLKHSERLVALIQRIGSALEPDESKLMSQMLQTILRLESGEGFNCEAIVSMRDGRPLIDCSWMGMLAQISPDQARSMAAGLFQPAAEADSDSAIVKFFLETGLPAEKAAHAVSEIRNLRQRRDPVVGDKQEPYPLQHITPLGGKPS